VSYGAKKTVLEGLFRVLRLAEYPEGCTIKLRGLRCEKMAKCLSVTVQSPLKPLVWLSNGVAIFSYYHGVLL
jgi:hypothetical protein